MTSQIGNGIVNVPGHHSVDQTVEKLKEILQAKGVALFATVDHSGEAEKVGLKMPPTKLLIFGSPKAGTPLMLAAPSIAIDLPLKILVWQDASGQGVGQLQQPRVFAAAAHPASGAAAKHLGSRNIGEQDRGMISVNPSRHPAGYGMISQMVPYPKAPLCEVVPYRLPFASMVTVPYGPCPSLPPVKSYRSVKVHPPPERVSL